MKEGRTIRGTLMVLTALALSACAASKDPATALDPRTRAERPTYALGAKWIRNDGGYTLIRIENDRYIFAAGPNQEIHLTKDLMVARVQKGQLFMEFDPPPALTWPLEVGKWGASHGIWRSREFPQEMSATFTWSVEAFEEIHVVSAGIFKAFRIALSGVHKGYPHSGNWRTWYAPEQRQFVKTEGFGLASFLNFELVAARPSVTVPSFRLPDRVQQAFGEYQSSPRFYNFKAFSFDEMSGSSGRAWGYYTPKRAIDRAVRECSKQSRECKLYAVGDTIVWGMPPEKIGAITEEYFARTAEAAGFPPGTTHLNPIPEVGQKSPAGIRLSSDEIRQYLSGKVFEGTTAAGLRFVGEYSNDGTMSGKADSLADTGTWTVRANTLCRQWRKLFDGEMDCLVVLRDGETLRVYDSKGQAMGSGLPPHKAIAPRN